MAAAALESEAVPTGTLPTVAIVDPDWITCKLLREICLAGAWNVVGCAQSVQGGLAVLVQSRPAYLITDFKFAGQVTGLDLIAQAKRLLPTLFTVMLTGWDINDVAAQVSAHPPDRILRKPVPPHILIDLLNEIDGRLGPIRIEAV